MNATFSPNAKQLCQLLLFLSFHISAIAQPTQVILQKGHESSPVQAAAISPDNQVLVTVDQAGKVVLWDIATGLQLDEVHTEFYSDARVEFLPGKNRSVWVDNLESQLVEIDFSTRRVGVRYWGLSLECQKNNKNTPNDIVAQKTFVDPCESVLMKGQLGAKKEHYIFTTEYNELYTCHLNRTVEWEDFDYFFRHDFEPEYITQSPPSSDPPPAKSKIAAPKEKSKVMKVVPSQDFLPRSSPNNIIKSFTKLPWTNANPAMNRLTSLPLLHYNEQTKRVAYALDNHLVLADLSGDQMKTINRIETDKNALTWVSPNADYAALAKGDEFSWIRLADGAQTTMTTQSGRRVKQLEVFPEQSQVLIVRANDQLELYDFDNQALLFERQFKETVNALTLSQNGEYLATYHGEKGVYLWSIPNNTLVRIFKANIPDILNVQLTTAEDQLLTISEDKAIYSLQLGQSFAFRNLLSTKSKMHKGRFSPDGKTLLWTTQEDSRTLRVSHEGKGQSLRLARNFDLDKFFFSPDSRHFALTAKDGQIDVYKLDEKLTQLASFPPLDIAINHLAFHPEKPLLAVAYRDRIELVDWQKEPPENWGQVSTQSNLELGNIRFGQSKTGGNTLGADQEDTFWPRDPGDLVYVEFSRTGTYLLLRGAPQAAILKLGENNELKRLFPRKNDPFKDVFATGLINNAFESSIYSPVFLDNDQKILLESDQADALEIWDFETVGEELLQHDGNRYAFTSQPLYRVDTEAIPYRSYVMMQTQPIIIFNCGIYGVKLVNYKTGDLLTTIYPVNEQRMLLINPDLYYYTTSRGHDMLAFKQGEKVYPLEQFDLQFNRPDKVLRSIGLTGDSTVQAFYYAYLKRLKKLDFTEEAMEANFDLPQLEVLTTDLPTSTTQAALRFRVRASDPSALLAQLQVYINDVPIYGSQGIDLQPRSVQRIDQSIDLTLSKGENKVQVSVINQAGRESLRETFYITYEAPDVRPNLYFIGIGVSNYKNDRKNLRYPVKDLEDLAALFQKDTAHFGQVYVHFLKDEEVTLEQVQALKEVLMQTGVNDRVILMYAGHGLLDKQFDYYLATHSTNFGQPELEGVPYETFEQLLDGIPSRYKLSLVDACHSGEIDRENTIVVDENPPPDDGILFRSGGTTAREVAGGLQNSFELMKHLFVDLRRITGATVISSASGVEFAIEGENWKNSVFTFCLLKGLESRAADLDQDGLIMISELQQYLAGEVSRLTQGRQQPTMRIENIANDWAVW